MTPDKEQSSNESAEVTPLPIRNEMHYDWQGFDRVDWSHGAAHMKDNHGITPERPQIFGPGEIGRAHV